MADTVDRAEGDLGGPLEALSIPPGVGFVSPIRVRPVDPCAACHVRARSPGASLASSDRP